MKTYIKNPFLLPALIAGLGLILAGRVTAQNFTNLYNFTGFDGAEPKGGLILSGNTLYGTAQLGGSSGNGMVFAINTNGTGFTNLHTFTATLDPDYTNSDGAYPNGGLMLLGNTLCGTAAYGGSSGNGTVFAVHTDGTGFTNLHNFSGPPYTGPPITNTDGANPGAGLILSGNTLFGTAPQGGSSGNGTVFAINTSGAGFTNLHSFNSGSDGANPQASLLLSGNTLYGTASGGGTYGNGTVFSLSLGSVSAPPPQLTIIPSGADVILTWPTDAAGFTLQSTTNLVSPAVWTTVSPAPVVVNGQNAVTNPSSGPQKFFRLSQ
jgi:uncharacterized repeat protein (TIGR03803 family)